MIFTLLWHSSEPGALCNIQTWCHWREHLANTAKPEPTKMSHTLRLPLNSDCVTPETTRLAVSVHIPRALYRSPYSTQPRLQRRIEWVKAPHYYVVLYYIWESNNSADIYNILSSKLPYSGIRLSPGLSVTFRRYVSAVTDYLCSRPRPKIILSK